MNSIKILIWNCRGVARRRLELLQFVNEHKIDILLLNETHLNNSSFKLPNFHAYFTNNHTGARGLTHGGTAVLVHRRFIHHSIKIATSSITNTTVLLQLGNSELRLVAVYKRPKSHLLTTDLDSLLNTDANTIIAGDLNSKHSFWHSRRNNTAGRILSRYIDSRPDLLISAPTSPTHYPDNPLHNPDILDIALLKTNRLNFHMENHPSKLSSDHTPIILELFKQATQISPKPPSHIIDWVKFESIMKNTPFSSPSIDSPQAIDNSIANLSLTISSALDSCSSTNNSSINNPALPRNIMREIS